MDAGPAVHASRDEDALGGQQTYASGVSDLDLKARINAAAMQITKPITIALVAIE